MTLNEYQQQAMTTCLPSSNNFAYMLLGLLGEVGEILEKVNSECKSKTASEITQTLLHCGRVAKLIRKNPGNILAACALADFKHFEEYVKTHREDILSELGDCAWMLNGMFSVLGFEAEEVGNQNLEKLASRQQRNVIDGNGDNR